MSADKLQALLQRARHTAELARQAALKTKLKRNASQRAILTMRIAAEATKISEDYAGRLAERRRFRELLSDNRLDGERFRWYFTHIEDSISLDQLRTWIDGKISREQERKAS